MLFQMRFRTLFTLLLSLIVPAGSASADMRSSKCDSDIPGIGKVYSAGIIRENPDLLNEYRRGFFPCWEVSSAAFCQALIIEN